MEHMTSLPVNHLTLTVAIWVQQ